MLEIIIIPKWPWRESNPWPSIRIQALSTCVTLVILKHRFLNSPMKVKTLSNHIRKVGLHREERGKNAIRERIAFPKIQYLLFLFRPIGHESPYRMLAIIDHTGQERVCRLHTGLRQLRGTFIILVVFFFLCKVYSFSLQTHLTKYQRCLLRNRIRTVEYKLDVLTTNLFGFDSFVVKTIYSYQFCY